MKNFSEIRNLDWIELVDRMARSATSELARQLVRAMKPLDTREEAEKSVEKIAETSNLIRRGLRPHMESLDLFATWFPRLERGAVLKPLELRDVRSFCLETVALMEVLKSERSPFLTSVFEELMSADEPLSAIDQVMTPSGDIRMDASETMYRLHQEKTGIARQLHTLLDKAVKNHRIEHLLQDKYVTTREGRWVLPIRSGQQHHFPGIIHDSSQSKQTVFMEPQECVPLNNRLREIELEIEAEIERLLTELSTYLTRMSVQFKSTKSAMLEMDFRLSLAALCVQVEAEPIRFSDNVLRLENVRHPLLVLNGVKVVPNSVVLNQKQRLLLLSGPNAGGKTVLLKSIGLAAQMARAGMPVCAEAGSELPFFENIVVGVGDAQSVDANLSTFAAHLKMLDAAAHVAGFQSLILIDEICGSTDPEEGAALARSFILNFSENEVFGVITSHLGALKTGWEAASGVVSGSLEFDKGKGPTYRFLLGLPGQSLAIQTAKRVGVDNEIIERAYTFLSPEIKKYEQGLEEVEKLKSEIWRLQETLMVDRKNLTEDKKKYAQMIADFEREREKLLDKEIKSSRKRLEEEIEATKAQEVFSRHRELQKIKYELPKVVKGEGQHRPSLDEVGEAAGGADEGFMTRTKAASVKDVFADAEEFARAFPAGSHVSIPSLNKDGIVQGLPNAKGEVVVLSGSMRLSLGWRDLRAPQKNYNPTRDLVRRSSVVAGISESDHVVDVRGMTSEAAISHLEIELDKASLRGDDRIKVVHGHGTDALKRAVRTYLSRSVYVKKWFAGTAETGGDGLTWIEIK